METAQGETGPTSQMSPPQPGPFPTHTSAPSTMPGAGLTVLGSLRWLVFFFHTGHMRMCGLWKTKGYFYGLIVSFLSVLGPQPRHTSALPPRLPTPQALLCQVPAARPPAVPQGCPWNRPGLQHEQAVRLGRGAPEPGLGDPLLRWASQPPPTPTAHLDLRSVQKRPLEQR